MAGDVVDLIMNDHREVERLFDELMDEPGKRPNLVPVLTTLLTAHSRAEEAEVYPVAADEAGESEEVAHSQEEHVEADELLAKLAATDPTSPDFDAVLRELVDAVTHHVEEEESDLLPGIREGLSVERLDELAEAFLAVRASHLGTEAGELSRSELNVMAENLGLEGTASMSKDKLQSEVESHAEEE